MESLRRQEGLSVARLCRLLGLPRSTHYHRRQLSTKRSRRGRVDDRLRQRVLELAKTYAMYGYRKLWALLKDERNQVSPSTVYRWLKEKNLLLAPRYQQQVRRRARDARRNCLWQVDITWVDLDA